jgi:uncharacterized membrane protein
MGTARLEAFSDGMIAIFITIMVLEMKVPHGEALSDLVALGPVFLSYVLSYLYLGIYWSNHHHMLHTLKRVTGGILWANLHLMFWLSLVPFTTAWMGENHFASMPTALYGFVLLMCAISYYLLQQCIIKTQGANSLLRRAVGDDWKGKLSPLLYITAMIVALWMPAVSMALYGAAALIWLVPDNRIERIEAHE